MSRCGKVWDRLSGSIPVRPVAACLPLLLAGCGAPPAFLWASLAIDTASVVSTGKTPGEHALSVVVQQDCSLRQLVADGDLCAPVAVDGDNLGNGALEAAADPYSRDLLTHN